MKRVKKRPINVSKDENMNMQLNFQDYNYPSETTIDNKTQRYVTIRLKKCESNFDFVRDIEDETIPYYSDFLTQKSTTFQLNSSKVDDVTAKSLFELINNGALIPSHVAPGFINALKETCKSTEAHFIECLLGLILLKGIGVQSDRSIGLKYLTRAAVADVNEAKELLIESFNEELQLSKRPTAYMRKKHDLNFTTLDARNENSSKSIKVRIKFKKCTDNVQGIEYKNNMNGGDSYDF